MRWFASTLQKPWGSHRKHFAFIQAGAQPRVRSELPPSAQVSAAEGARSLSILSQHCFLSSCSLWKVPWSPAILGFYREIVASKLITRARSFHAEFFQLYYVGSHTCMHVHTYVHIYSHNTRHTDMLGKSPFDVK